MFVPHVSRTTDSSASRSILSDARAWLSAGSLPNALSPTNPVLPRREASRSRVPALSPSANAKLIRPENANRSRMNREPRSVAGAECTSGDVVAADGVVLHEIKNVSLPFAQELPLLRKVWMFSGRGRSPGGYTGLFRALEERSLKCGPGISGITRGDVLCIN